MKKKFYGALVLGSLLLSGGMVSCSDYDDDINSLNQRVDGIQKTLDDLKAKIEAGSVITSVTPSENGVTVTLSNGESFEIKNGTNGTNGTNGSVVAIDEDGYWTIDGKQVKDKNGNPIKAAGEKGDKGDQGNPGADGKDGVWYEPNENGTWDKCYYNEKDEVVKEPTDMTWIPAADEGVRVVYNTEGGYMLIYGAEGTDEAIRIDITSDLKSLAVIPDVLDKETNYPLVFFYNIMGYDVQFEDGDMTVDNKAFAASTYATARYRLNPANANTEDWTWDMIDRTVARVAGDNKNDLLTVTKTEKAEGEMIVTLKANKSLGYLAEDALFKEHAIAALQGTNKSTNEVIASDYIKVAAKELTQFSIINGYIPDTKEAFELPEAGSEDEAQYDARPADLKMLYTESLDLSKYLSTWAKEIKSTSVLTMVDDMVDEGQLTYEYILPPVYKIGNNETNQQDFASLEGSVLKVNTKNYPNGTGAIGGTPIVWVRAVINNKTIATAVVKVAITKEGETEKPTYVVSAEATNLEYNNIKADEVVNEFSWDDMRKVYDDLKMTREEFIEHYATNGTTTISTAIGATLKDLTDDAVGTQTNAVTLSFDPAVVPSNVTNGMIKITYTPDNLLAYAPVVIEFPYTISHKHASFPAFNDTYVKDNVAEIRGNMVAGQWKMSTEVSEHFKLNEYKLEGNHIKLYAVVRDAVRLGVMLDGTAVENQTLTLTRPVVGDHTDVLVDLVAEKANGETNCLTTYTVRFLNHFTLEPAKIVLNERGQGQADSKKISYTVKERFDKKRTLVKADGKIDATLLNEYGIAESDVVTTYAEGENWGTKFGLNNDKTQKLSLDTKTHTITWNNAGTALTGDQTTTYDVTVKINGISVMQKSANVTIEKL